MSSNRPQPPVRRDWQREAADPSWDPRQLRRMSWRAEGAQDYPGGALETLLEIAQRRELRDQPGAMHDSELEDCPPRPTARDRTTVP